MRAGGLINGSVSGVCQQICSEVLWDAHFLPRLSVLRSLLHRASVMDNYRQFKLGHGTQCACNEISCLHHNHTIKLSPSLCQTTMCHKNFTDNFYVLNKSRTPERSLERCTSPFTSLKAYSFRKITIGYPVTFVFIWGYDVCACQHTNACTPIPIHNLAFFVCYITVSGSYFS